MIRKVLYFVSIFMGFLIAGLLSYWLGRLLGVDPGWLLLAIMLLISGLLSIFILWQRRKLGRWLGQQAEETQDYLRSSDSEFRFTPGSFIRAGISPSTATRIGVVWVNLPLIPCFILPLFIYQGFLSGGNPWISGMLLVIGFILAWLWWSVNVSLWRRWAVKRGVDPDELQWKGEEANLLWPEGHLLERTELSNLLSLMRGQRKDA